MVVTALAGLLFALALWCVGLVAAPPAAGMAALLGLTKLSGLATLVLTLRAPAPLRPFGWSAATIALGLAVAFVVRLFAVSGGSVPVTRRIAEPAADVESIRLVNFNVLHGYPSLADQEQRYRRLAAALAALDPTVIVLQEAWSIVGHGHLAERLGADLRLDVAFARANGSRRLLGFEEGSAVLSRLPIASARRLVLAPRRPFWEARIALVVELETGRGRTLPIVATHLTHQGARIAHLQARDLATRLAPAEPRAGGPAVVAGDFNAPSGSAAVAVFEELGLVDAVRGGVDHVLVSDSLPWRLAAAAWTLRPRDLAELIGEAAAISDHPGIVVDLERR